MTENESQRGKHPNSQANLKPFGSADGNPQAQNAGGNKPWSIRNSVRYLAHQPIDMDDPKAFKKILPKNPTAAQLIAANVLAKASKADMRAVEYVTEQIDGKIAQTNINTDFAEIMRMTEDELRAIADGCDAAAPAGSGPDAPPIDRGSPEPAENEVEPSRPPGNTTGL